MTNVSVVLTPDSAPRTFSALAYVPWSFLSSNRSNERAKIYLPAYIGSVENIVHCDGEGGIHEIRLALSMPPSDKVVPALVVETEYPNQTPIDYLIELIHPNMDSIPADVQSDLNLAELYALLRSFHAYHLSFKSYPHHGTSQESTPILTTAFNSSDANGDSLARAFRGYPFSFRIYHGDFPSYEKEPQRAYDSTIIIADVDNADDLVGRIRKILNPEKIIVTREKLVGTKKVFAKPIL